MTNDKNCMIHELLASHSLYKTIKYKPGAVIMIYPIRSFILIVFGVIISGSIFATGDRDDTSMPVTSGLLTPVILTLAIPEADRHSPEIIAEAQDRVLESLKPYRVENITRYRYLPQLALATEQTALDMLRDSKDIVTMSMDSLSAPHSNKPSKEPRESNQTEGTLPSEKTPCKRNSKGYD